MVTRKIKIQPSKKQKELFQKLFQANRYFYNKAIGSINKQYQERRHEFINSATCVHCTEPKYSDTFCCVKHQKKALPWKLNTSFISLRNDIIKSDKLLKGTEDKWQIEIPYDTRQLAIKDAATAYKSCMTNKRNGNITTFDLKYKCRRNPSQLFWIDSNAIKYVGNKLQIFPNRLKKDKFIRMRNRQHNKIQPIEHDCKIMKYGKSYYLVYTFDKTVEANTTNDNRHHAIALDPGVRTFQTGYSPSGIAIKAGERQNEQLKRLHNKLDILRGLRSKATLRRKQRLKNSCLKLEQKIKNVVDNLHNQTSSFLAKSFNNVLLPKFSTSEMQSGKGLHSTTKRQLWTLSHYKFQQKMIGLCQQYRSKLYLVEEHYTTKTCGGCGKLVNVGSSKVFECSECSYKMDRDIHGARNILLKHVKQ
jgi:transposase